MKELRREGEKGRGIEVEEEKEGREMKGRSGEKGMREVIRKDLQRERK